MLQPKRRKFRKEHKGRNTGVASRGTAVSFGEYGLKSIAAAGLPPLKSEAAARAMTRHIKRGGVSGSVSFRISRFPVSQPKWEWEMVRATQSIMWLKSSTEKCYMKWMAFRKRWRARHSAWRRQSCL